MNWSVWNLYGGMGIATGEKSGHLIHGFCKPWALEARECCRFWNITQADY